MQAVNLASNAVSATKALNSDLKAIGLDNKNTILENNKQNLLVVRQAQQDLKNHMVDNKALT